MTPSCTNYYCKECKKVEMKKEGWKKWRCQSCRHKVSWIVSGVKNASMREEMIEKSAEEVPRIVDLVRTDDKFLSSVLGWKGGRKRMRVRFENGVWRHDEEEDDNIQEEEEEEEKKKKRGDERLNSLDSLDGVFSSDSDDGSSRDIFRRITHSGSLASRRRRRSGRRRKLSRKKQNEKKKKWKKKKEIKTLHFFNQFYDLRGKFFAPIGGIRAVLIQPNVERFYAAVIKLFELLVKKTPLECVELVRVRVYYILIYLLSSTLTHQTRNLVTPAQALSARKHEHLYTMK